MTFEEFYNLNFSKVYKFFYYKFVQKDEIEDLAQDVFMRFYKKYAPSLEKNPQDSLKLLYGICRNVYREWVRKSMKDRTVAFVDEYEYEDSDESLSAEDQYLFDAEKPEESINFNLEELKIHLESLNEKVRLVLQYRFLEGKSRKETAEIMKIAEKDVHTYQKRGIKYLKKLVENEKK